MLVVPEPPLPPLAIAEGGRGTFQETYDRRVHITFSRQISREVIVGGFRFWPSSSKLFSKVKVNAFGLERQAFQCTLHDKLCCVLCEGHLMKPLIKNYQEMSKQNGDNFGTKLIWISYDEDITGLIT